MKKEIKHKLRSIQHLITGIFLLLKGCDKVEHNYLLIGWVILGMGIAVVSYYLFLKMTNNNNSLLNMLVHLFEGIALLFTTYVFIKEGKTYLPYVTLLAGIGFLVAVVVHWVKHNKKKQSSIV
jgi:presenilin-like A22 family membrane protease